MTEQPKSAEELADVLARAASAKNSIELGGGFSKRAGAGPIPPGDVTVSTSGLTRILAYEPRDLTISVEAGIRYQDLIQTLAANRQMIPLDPPFSDTATIGGIIASNSSGPRRRLYGTARDMVIGMKFATVEGKLIQCGGMVVKNVAGLDMAKLMIGSWGTLAAIASVNFKLLPAPAVERTLLLGMDSPAAAFEVRDNLIRGVLQPSAVDFINRAAASDLGFKKAFLAVEFGGNEAVIERSRREMFAWGEPVEQNAEEADQLWNRIRNFTPTFLARTKGAAVVRISATLTGLREVLGALDVPAIVRAASGVVYAYFSQSKAAAKWMAENARWTSVMEYAPAAEKDSLELWPSPGSEIEMMKRVKEMFDPQNLLNRGRYYRHF
jgi:glycolate oxidase FAD binding subunit